MNDYKRYSRKIAALHKLHIKSSLINRYALFRHTNTYMRRTIID